VNIVGGGRSDLIGAVVCSLWVWSWGSF